MGTNDSTQETGTGQMPALFTPFTLRDVTFRNRLVVSAMCQYASEDGFINDEWHLAHHGRFALGGVGGAILEASGVTAEGRITPGCLGIYKDEHVPGLKKVVDIYHAQGIPVGIQLAHAGRKASAATPLNGAKPLVDSDPDAAWQAVAPSAIPLTEDWPTPHALEASEIDDLIVSFANATQRALDAGFDFVEIHGAHGYLIHSFLTPLSNQRGDQWGGDLAARMRFPLAVTDAVRKTVPKGYPVFYRASSVDGVDGGMELEDTIELSRQLKARGVDLIDCSSGGITGASGRAKAPPSPGYLVPYARAVRDGADMPTMAVGLITEAEQANSVVVDGNADLVAMARGLLADPNFPYHAAIELGHPEPHTLLPAMYGMVLKRRNSG
ncbi:NADH:flavin oxidoreductase/NADH oxidase [Chromatocurvus halotolerans]|uniref:2,4-dienoyl-CoA reductase-like NADH-dependent reductase (Old Yellow Enzyme family) n=1 Tax=Chromatocurvus halotolerans TaxID=1132028 RepID=A0A4V2SBW7_9GAMM|nr:NADH:flavin oxidoreductase/NADH oxidase [Chromatocurvus halotolerans]TCO77100.1 2,4-dienoyl-CoA reductase-like NADH-dependent reductase (Old Yellow Enzyme family) [Chromatocurvus halotolerans]